MSLQKNPPVQDRAFLDSLKVQPCAACGLGPCDPAHIKTRGSGGGDTWDNVLPLCREHHTEQHKRGMRFMELRYPALAHQLKIRGWRYDSFLLRWERSGGEIQ